MSDSPKKPGAPIPNFRAFTLRADGLQYRIQFIVTILRAKIGDTQGLSQDQLKKHTQYTAVLDTAAPCNRVSRAVIEEAGLKPIDDNGHVTEYLADIYLPNMIRFAEIPVSEIPPELGSNADCLIGMDVLSCADCSLSHHGRKMMFSFRVPACGTPDFVEEHQRLHKGAKRMIMTSSTRNQLCPCGSGKRFKNCCGKLH